VRVGDLLNPAHFESRLRELLDWHNFLLQHHLKEAPADFAATLAECRAQAERIRPLVGDVTLEMHRLRAEGANVLLEGAQATLLDVDHGTYPFVTSSNTVAGYAAVGTGLGPRDIDAVLGIVKAYTTRVGAGPFPTELDDEAGRHLSRIGQEFGAVTGRPRRTGWFDAVAMRRSIMTNGITALCVTKLDVMDGLAEVKICVDYGGDGEPVYETMPGWNGTTAGLRSLAGMPAEARSYLARLESVCGVPVTIVSTGPDREQTIMSRNPFD
jgi:adenylosuccinate synthase